MPFSQVLPLFFLSGLSGLIYEVLWLKQLGLLFGNASYAMATTLAAFFSGLAAGGAWWGKRVQHSRHPLRLYGFLELGVAVCALGYFVLLKTYAFFYPWIMAGLIDDRVGLAAVKFVLALLILFPPAWFMGGTLPVISHAVIHQAEPMGHKVSLLYVSNTLGAVVGVFLAGFYLPPVLGFSNSYLLAMSITVWVGLGALFLDKRQLLQHLDSRQKKLHPEVSWHLKTLAFVSGLSMLALQVLWGRMFAQVLQNSVYTFSLILMLFLAGLAFGGLLANRLMKSTVDAQRIMFFLLLAGALLIALTPAEFVHLTDKLHYLGADTGWFAYLGNIGRLGLWVMGPALLFLGSVFPYLLRLTERQTGNIGSVVGQLTALNTLGAILGSLLAGFVLLDTLGLWASIRLLAIVYALLAWLWMEHTQLRPKYLFALPALLIVLMVSVFDTSRLPVVRVDPVVDQESLLQVWEGSGGTVAVIRQGQHLKLKVNNYYTLGGSGSFELEQFLGYFPLLLHERPQSVYVLGLGSGISAGGCLRYPVKRLLVTELLPEVVTASDKYFGDYTNGLFYDPRVRVRVEDGRNYLRGTSEQFDVIISDLFVPWKAGAGNLYSLQHYQTARQRLSEHGLFMQWLPAYQISEDEFAVIAHTMRAVFPQVTVWRGDFGALKPVIGLLGQKNRQPLHRQAGIFTSPLADKTPVPLLSHYAGNLDGLKELWADAPLNTDDLPIIEFQAPISQRQSKTGSKTWLAGDSLMKWMRLLIDRDDGYYLSAVGKPEQILAQAGFHLHYAQWLRYQGKLTVMDKELQIYRKLLSKARH